MSRSPEPSAWPPEWHSDGVGSAWGIGETLTLAKGVENPAPVPGDGSEDTLAARAGFIPPGIVGGRRRGVPGQEPSSAELARLLLAGFPSARESSGSLERLRGPLGLAERAYAGTGP